MHKGKTHVAYSIYFIQFHIRLPAPLHAVDILKFSKEQILITVVIHFNFANHIQL